MSTTNTLESTNKLSPAGEDLLKKICFHGRNSGPDFLFDAIWCGGLPESDFPKLVGQVWSMCEYPARAMEPEEWLELFNDIGFCNEAGNRVERPQEITLYRGASVHESETGEYGMSWTTDRGMAIFFAHVYFARSGDNRVYRCVMPGSALVADYRDGGRNESEIVVNPSLINPDNVTIEELTPAELADI